MTANFRFFSGCEHVSLARDADVLAGLCFVPFSRGRFFARIVFGRSFMAARLIFIVLRPCRPGDGTLCSSLLSAALQSILQGAFFPAALCSPSLVREKLVVLTIDARSFLAARLSTMGRRLCFCSAGARHFGDTEWFDEFFLILRLA